MNKLSVLVVVSFIANIYVLRAQSDSFASILKEDLNRIQADYEYLFVKRVKFNVGDSIYYDNIRFEEVSADTLFTKTISRGDSDEVDTISLIRHNVKIYCFLLNLDSTFVERTFYTVKVGEQYFKMFGFYTCNIGLLDEEVLNFILSFSEKSFLSKQKIRIIRKEIYLKKAISTSVGMPCVLLELVFGKGDVRSSSIYISLRYYEHSVGLSTD